jgi:putative acetyltransferase
VIVRDERPEDRDAVRRVEVAAFERDVEADLVDVLRDDPAWEVSLVAEDDGEVVGHLLLTRARLGEAGELLALGPVAVLPERQRGGVGGALMRSALERAGGPVVLLGHPDYYVRFGFEPAAPRGITNQWGLTGPEWMVRGDAPAGLVLYPQPFADLA